MADTVDLDALAASTPGMVGADLANLANEAALLAARRDHDQVEPIDFTDSLEKISELDRRFDELAQKGIGVVSLSGETEERASRMRDEWHIDKLPLAYGLSEARMREWGLFVSRGIKDDEPAVFNEPALFLISPDGSVYYESILSMPVGRPRLDDLLGGIDYWTANDYPARGGA